MKRFFLAIAIFTLPLLSANATERVVDTYTVSDVSQNRAEKEALAQCQDDLHAHQECRLSGFLSGSIFTKDYYGNDIYDRYKAVVQRIQLAWSKPRHKRKSRRRSGYKSYNSSPSYGSSYSNSSSGYGY